MTVEKVLSELKEIAEELRISFDNDDVLTHWCRRNSPGMPEHIADKIFPIYTSKLKEIYGVRIKDGIVTHIKKEKDGDYEPA